MKTKKLIIVIPVLILLIGMIFWVYAENNKTEQKKILIFTQDDKIKADFEDSAKYKEYSGLLEIRNLNEQTKIRLSRYEAIVFPYPNAKIKDRLKKYYNAGVGIYFYDLNSIKTQGRGSLILSKLNKLIKLSQAEEGIKILGLNKTNTNKLADFYIKDTSIGEEKPFHIIGRYGSSGKFVFMDYKVNENEASDYIIKSIVDSHHASIRPQADGRFNGVVTITKYDSESFGKISVSHDILRDYESPSPDEFDFSIYSKFYINTNKYFVEENSLKIDTNEPASIISGAPLNLSISPFKTVKTKLEKKSTLPRDELIYSKQIEVKSNIDKARQRATWTIKPTSLLPLSVSGQKQTCLTKIRTKKDRLNLSVESKSKFVYGYFKEYNMEGPEFDSYSLVIEF